MGNNFFKRDDRDLHFVLKEQLHIEKLLELDQYKDFSMSDFDMVLDQARIIAEKELAPYFQNADRDGPHYENGRVTVPEYFHSLWEVFKNGSWFALSQSPQYGGQGLPTIIDEAAKEFFFGANLAFFSYAGMGAGNGAMIENYGSDKLKDLFLEKLYNGTWGACMCLSESAAGSDAHMITTKAIPDGDYYKIQGKKIFITSGDHDLTENIINLVIARIEGAPQGAKGVSLFAVPKIWVNEDGSLGEPNDVTCIGIEHKMGLHGWVTAAMNYGDNDNCRGYLIGKPGMGLAYMFQMVNLARMAVGLEAVAFGAIIYGNALEYAKERIQGTPFGAKGDKQRVRIIEHADVRRMLMNLKALTEGIRSLVYTAYFQHELSLFGKDEKERHAAVQKLELLTPIIKAYCSDRLFEMGREGIQILGGYGFTKEYPIEQYTRDCKIFSIWDGTNYIQSMDLVGRKLSMDGGNVFESWVKEIKEFLRVNMSREDIGNECRLLQEALAVVEDMRNKYALYFQDKDKIDLVPLTSTRFLDCCAEVAISHLLLEQALIAAEKNKKLEPGQSDYDFYSGKIETARYYVRNFLPNVFGRKRMFDLEDKTPANLREEQF